MPARATRSRVAAVLVASTLLAVVLSACRLDATADLVVAADGSGRLGLAVELDRDTADRLTAGGLSLAPAEPAGWTVDEQVTDDGHRVTMEATFDDPAALATLVDGLAAGLDDQDPSLLARLDLDVAADGAARLDGTAGLRVPSSAGADVAGWPTADELVALARAEDVTATLRVSFPGDVTDSNASLVAGNTATWELPVGDQVDVRATATAPSVWASAWIAWAAAGVTILLVVALVAQWRRRRRERRSAPMGRVERLQRHH